MGEHYSILNLPQDVDDRRGEPAKTVSKSNQPDPNTRGSLTPCPDCQHKCSTYAETCPSCGRFFRSYRSLSVTPGKGWSTAVGWGFILGWLFAAFLGFCLLIVLMVLGGIAAASLPTR
jgi:hypothetical protein